MPLAVDSLVLSQSQINELKSNGVKFIGRYLSKTSWKGLTVAEIAMYKQAGIDIFSIYETNPTHNTYFNFAQGQADASAALALAKAVSQPANTAIYFTVDFDAQARDFAAIEDYFKAIKSTLKEYKVGAYGSFAVLANLQDKCPVDYYFQTCAWSYTSKLSYMHVYQAETNAKVGTVPVDVNELYHNNQIGSWAQPVVTEVTTEKAPTPPPVVKPAVEPTPAPATSAPIKQDATAAPQPVETSPTPVAPEIIETKVNIIAKSVKGQNLTDLEDYLTKKGWWNDRSLQSDGSYNVEVGIFIANTPSYYHFIDFVTTLGLSYSIKAQ